MTTLTPMELREIQVFVGRTMDYLHDLDLRVDVDGDLAKWRDVMTAAGTPVAATHDPDRNFVNAGNSFWVKILDRDGAVVGCGANRLLSTDDFMEEVLTHRLFGDRHPVLEHYPLHIDEDAPQLSGRISVGGGIWVQREWRDKALGGTISRLLRSLSLRHFSIDWHTGFVAVAPQAEKLSGAVYGFPNATRLLTGRHPGYQGKDHDVILVWIHRFEIVKQLAAENQAAMGRESSRRRIA